MDPSKFRLEFGVEKNPPRTTSARQYYWAEVGHAAHRLLAVGDALVGVPKLVPLSKSLPRLEVLCESYRHRAFELRERTIALVQTETGDLKLDGKLRRPDQRAAALAGRGRVSPEFSGAAKDMLELLDFDCEFRSIHAHETPCRLVALESDGCIQIEDVVRGVEALDRVERTKVVRNLRAEIRKLVTRYRKRIDEVTRCAANVMDVFMKAYPMPLEKQTLAKAVRGRGNV